MTSCVLLLRGALVLGTALGLFATQAWAFGLDDVALRASKLAASPYQKPAGTLPKSVKALTYDQYRDIRFRPDRALWRNAKLPFEIMFFHPGWFHEDTVVIHEVWAEGVRDIPFDPDLFDYGRNKIDREELAGLGYAGFRVHFPVNTPTYKDEVLVFLGASYFRGLGRGQRFGLSASTRCSIRRGRRVPIGSSSDPAPRRRSMWRRGCFCARTSPSSGWLP